MKPIFFALPGNSLLGTQLAHTLNAPIGELTIRSFPDEETYIQVLTPVENKVVILICTLDRPDQKLLPLYFLAKTLKEQGASKVILLAPYLSYMRQDIIFKTGEALTSKYFAQLLSHTIDGLITVDPHLHRISRLEEIYTIPTQVIHAANTIAQWIKTNIQQPVLIGPDSESEQWVSAVAKEANAPFLVLEKTRHGDKSVTVSIPQVEAYATHQPILVDDIISTARTMMKTVEHLKKAGMRPPICIGIHAIFAERAYEDLMEAGTAEILTCNTVIHPSNTIGLNDLYLECIQALLKVEGND